MIFWTIVILLSLGNALTDNVLLASHNKEDIELYRDKFIDNCKSSYTEKCNEDENKNECCNLLFERKTMWRFILVIFTSIFGLFIIIFFAKSSSFVEIRKKYLEIQELEYISINYSIADYKNNISNWKDIIKSNRKKFIIPFFILIWQFLYLCIIIGYNRWYIPSNTSSDTTMSEARKLVLEYIPILCFFNVFWVAFVCPILFIVYFVIYCCIESCINERKNIKNNISGGKNNVRLYDIDVIDNEFKKSNFV
jgi:hypothetical protein